MHISRSIWNGHVGAPKTRKSAAPVPAIRQVAERLQTIQIAAKAAARCMPAMPLRKTCVSPLQQLSLLQQKTLTIFSPHGRKFWRC
jgi:hypothetical protein